MIELALAFYAGGATCALLAAIGAARKARLRIHPFALVTAAVSWPLAARRTRGTMR